MEIILAGVCGWMGIKKIDTGKKMTININIYAFVFKENSKRLVLTFTL